MTDNPPTPSASPADILDQAAKTAATPPPPRFRIVRANLPALLHTMLVAAGAPGQALDAAIKKAAETIPVNDAIATTPHYETVREWCASNPDNAAHIVLCAVYLANGRFAAQEELEPPAAAAPTPAPPAPEGEQTGG